VFAQNCLQSGCCTTAIEKCGFFGTIERVSCVSISTKVSRSTINTDTSLVFHPRSQRGKDRKSKRQAPALSVNFSFWSVSSYSKPEPTAPKCGDPLMAFQLLFKTVSIDMLSYPDRAWRNEVWRNSKLSGGIHNLWSTLRGGTVSKEVATTRCTSCRNS